MRPGRLLRSQNDVVDLALSSGEFAANRHVRVISAAYMEYSAAASITTTSPAFIVLGSSE